MSVNEQPVGPASSVDVCDPHREILVRPLADASVLPFDHPDDDGVAPDVCGDVLQRSRPVGERAIPAAQLGPAIFVTGRRTPVRPHHGEARGVVHQIQVPVHFPAEPSIGSILRARQDTLHILVCDAIHHDIVPPAKPQRKVFMLDTCVSKGSLSGRGARWRGGARDTR